MSAPMVSVKAVSRRFGNVAALEGVSLDISRGEFFSLLGPSGCGKSTLLRMIGGFEFPDSGEIQIDGEPMADTPPHRRPTNMVFQSYALFPHLTVAQNIGYGLLNLPLQRGERDDIVRNALGMIRLAGFADRLPAQLSGGQRQRVALARALVRRPKVLLLDEPLGALDRALREEMQEELRTLQRTVGITFVFVTHDQEEALALSDRIAVMSAGRILQVAPPAALYHRPSSAAVAAMVGKINVLPGVCLSANGDATLVEVEGSRIRATATVGQARPGDTVQVLVRPENVTVSSQPAENAIRCRIVASQFTGAGYAVRLATGSGELPLTAVLPEEIAPGEAWVRFRDAAVSVAATVNLKNGGRHR
jgi:spermidine/putrescine transport system ATP-binding protein/putrescine transport system ATP-binding protein